LLRFTSSSCGRPTGSHKAEPRLRTVAWSLSHPHFRIGDGIALLSWMPTSS
jgi:hypothetical protein